MRLFALLFLLSQLVCCTSHKVNHPGIDYLKNSAISDTKGKLIDSASFYLPNRLFDDTTSDAMKSINRRANSFFSSQYMSFNVPILFNYFIGEETYRLIWLRSYDHPVLITLTKGDKIRINTKISNWRNSFVTKVYLPNGNPSEQVLEFDRNLERLKQSWPDADSIVIPEVIIITDTTSSLKRAEWDDFQKTLESSDFWQMEPYLSKLGGLDGSDWILEGHDEFKYKYVYRWSPQGKFRQICDKLIQLSAAKSEKVY